MNLIDLESDISGEGVPLEDLHSTGYATPELSESSEPGESGESPEYIGSCESCEPHELYGLGNPGGKPDGKPVGAPDEELDDEFDTPSIRGRAKLNGYAQGTKKSTSSSRVCSLTWVSDEARERESFRKMRLNMEYIAPKSPFVPADMKAWVEHRGSVLEAKARYIKDRIPDDRESYRDHVPPVLPGCRWADSRSYALAKETIWTPQWMEHPPRQPAPWPDSSERKHEGYQRMRSGYQRFLPLPRVAGNRTVNWKQRSVVPTYAFDKVGDPTGTERPIDIDERMEELVGKRFLADVESFNCPSQKLRPSRTRQSWEQNNRVIPNFWGVITAYINMQSHV